MKRKKDPNKLVAYGYVGRYAHGGLGWGVPTFLHDYKGSAPVKPAAEVLRDCYSPNEAFEVCRITIEVVPGRRKRTAAAFEGRP